MAQAPEISVCIANYNGVANNRMDAVARGDYLLLFNNGALLPPQLLSIPFAEAYRSRTPH